MLLKKFFHYLNPRTMFRRSARNVNLRMMHGINRISIFLFLICIVILIVRSVAR